MAGAVTFSNWKESRLYMVELAYPPFSAVDMPQTEEGAYFRICAMRLEYKLPLADSHTN